MTVSIECLDNEMLQWELSSVYPCPVKVENDEDEAYEIKIDCLRVSRSLPPHSNDFPTPLLRGFCQFFLPIAIVASLWRIKSKGSMPLNYIQAN